MSDYTRFDMPVSKDEFGGITTAPVVVQDELLPVMAKIVRSATKLVRLEQQTVYSLRGMDKALGESMLRQLRDRFRYDLEQTMRAEAQKMNHAIITPITHEETADALGVLFVARAVGMPLIEIEL